MGSRTFSAKARSSGAIGTLETASEPPTKRGDFRIACAQSAVDPDEGALAVGVDRRHPALDHHVSFGGQLVEKLRGCAALAAFEASGLERARGDHGLDDHLGLLPAAFAQELAGQPSRPA